MKVVWICTVSNKEIRSRIVMGKNRLEDIINKLLHRGHTNDADSAIWISNAIDQVKAFDDIEVHVIFPHSHLAEERQDFVIDGIRYHCFRTCSGSVLRKFIRIFNRNLPPNYKQNRKIIAGIIKDINPEIVHIIGAENPEYSLSLLDVPSNIPTILQLQALLSSLEGDRREKTTNDFDYKVQCEKLLISKADYIGTKVPTYIDYIRNNIMSKATIINTTLAMAQNIDISVEEKEFTFVHFAKSLSTAKASDIAIEAFAIVNKVYPNTSLDMIGDCSTDFKNKLSERLAVLGIRDKVKFEGVLPTHDDVILQIRKSHFALLPLQVDVLPNTVHEAMANGIPVLTSLTSGTPKLNRNRESVLISPKDDPEKLAENMIRLMKDKDFAAKLRENAAKTESEFSNNTDIVRHWVDTYHEIIRCKQFDEDLSTDFLNN